MLVDEIRKSFKAALVQILENLIKSFILQPGELHKIIFAFKHGKLYKNILCKNLEIPQIIKNKTLESATK